MTPQYQWNQQPMYTQQGYPSPYAPTQPVHLQRRERYPDGRRVYVGGFDPGSGYAALVIAPEDDLDQITSMVIPSWVSHGTLEAIGKRSALVNPDPVDQLDKDECVVGFNGEERYAGRLGREAGTNRTNALNDPRRYTNEHALALLFALCGLLIPEDRFTLKYVTALPISLYMDEKRRDVQDAFTREMPFLWNGQAKNGEFVCGAVVPEGAGGLMLYGDTTSRTLVLDYGYRTTDVLCARGQKVDFARSDGFPIGVGNLVDAFNDDFYSYAGRRLEEEEADFLLRAYIHNELLPEVRSKRKVIDSAKIRASLDRVYRSIGKESNTRVAQIVNVDKAGEIGAEFDRVIAIGGGAPHFQRALETIIEGPEVADNPQHANPEGYYEIARSFPAQTWERVKTEVAKRRGVTTHV